MKHLRGFNESSVGLFKEEIRDFCETNLAYLLDDGMKIFVEDYDVNKTNGISVCVDLSFRTVNKPSGGVKWMVIKDHMIPFLTRLKREYNLYDMNSYGHTYQLEVDRKPAKTFFGFEEILAKELQHESGSFEYCLTIDDVIGEKESILETGTIKNIRFYI